MDHHHHRPGARMHLSSGPANAPGRRKSSSPASGGAAVAGGAGTLGAGGGNAAGVKSPQQPALAIKRSETAPVTLQGWLYKQGSDGLQLWRKRWFVLSEFCLFYYKDPDEEKQLGSIFLPSYTISPLSKEDGVSRKYAFKAEHTNMRTYYFAAENKDSMLQWMNSLSLASILQNENNLKPEMLARQLARQGGYLPPQLRQFAPVNHGQPQLQHRPQGPQQTRALSPQPQQFQFPHRQQMPPNNFNQPLQMVPSHPQGQQMNFPQAGYNPPGQQTRFGQHQPQQQFAHDPSREQQQAMRHQQQQLRNQHRLSSDQDHQQAMMGQKINMSADNTPVAGPNGGRQPLYANAPPKPRRLNTSRDYSPPPATGNSVHEDDLDVFVDHQSPIRQHPGDGQSADGWRERSGGNRQSFGSEDDSRRPSADAGGSLRHHRAPQERRTPEAYGRSQSRVPKEYEEVYGGPAGDRTMSGQSRSVSRQGHPGGRPHSDYFPNRYEVDPQQEQQGFVYPTATFPANMNQAGSNNQQWQEVKYRDQQQQQQRLLDHQQQSHPQPRVPRPHSADFLEYERKHPPMHPHHQGFDQQHQGGVMDVSPVTVGGSRMGARTAESRRTSQQPVRPKSSIGELIRRRDSTTNNPAFSDDFWSEEMYAQKMRESSVEFAYNNNNGGASGQAVDLNTSRVSHQSVGRLASGPAQGPMVVRNGVDMNNAGAMMSRPGDPNFHPLQLSPNQYTMGSPPYAANNNNNMLNNSSSSAGFNHTGSPLPPPVYYQDKFSPNTSSASAGSHHLHNTSGQSAQNNSQNNQSFSPTRGAANFNVRYPGVQEPQQGLSSRLAPPGTANNNNVDPQPQIRMNNNHRHMMMEEEDDEDMDAEVVAQLQQQQHHVREHQQHQRPRAQSRGADRDLIKVTSPPYIQPQPTPRKSQQAHAATTYQNVPIPTGNAVNNNNNAARPPNVGDVAAVTAGGELSRQQAPQFFTAGNGQMMPASHQRLETATPNRLGLAVEWGGVGPASGGWPANSLTAGDFRRSASARLPKNKAARMAGNGGAGGFDPGSQPDDAGSDDSKKNSDQREESMKRLLEWKQRMLQSPLTRKSSRNASRTQTPTNSDSPVPSINNDDFRRKVMEELARQERAGCAQDTSTPSQKEKRLSRKGSSGSRSSRSRSSPRIAPSKNMIDSSDDDDFAVEPRQSRKRARSQHSRSRNSSRESSRRTSGVSNVGKSPSSVISADAGNDSFNSQQQPEYMNVNSLKSEMARQYQAAGGQAVNASVAAAGLSATQSELMAKLSNAIGPDDWYRDDFNFERSHPFLEDPVLLKQYAQILDLRYRESTAVEPSDYRLEEIEGLLLQQMHVRSNQFVSQAGGAPEAQGYDNLNSMPDHARQRDSFYNERVNEKNEGSKANTRDGMARSRNHTEAGAKEGRNFEDFQILEKEDRSVLLTIEGRDKFESTGQHSHQSNKVDWSPYLINNAKQTKDVPPKNMVKERLANFEKAGQTSQDNDKGQDSAVRKSSNSLRKERGKASQSKDSNGPRVRSKSVNLHYSSEEENPASGLPEAGKLEKKRSVKDLLSDFEKKSKELQEKEESLHHRGIGSYLLQDSLKDGSAGRRRVFSDTETLMYETSSEYEDNSDVENKVKVAEAKERKQPPSSEVKSPRVPPPLPPKKQSTHADEKPEQDPAKVKEQENKPVQESATIETPSEDTYLAMTPSKSLSSLAGTPARKSGGLGLTSCGSGSLTSRASLTSSHSSLHSGTGSMTLPRFGSDKAIGCMTPTEALIHSATHSRTPSQSLVMEHLQLEQHIGKQIEEETYVDMNEDGTIARTTPRQESGKKEAILAKQMTGSLKKDSLDTTLTGDPSESPRYCEIEDPSDQPHYEYLYKARTAGTQHYEVVYHEIAKEDSGEVNEKDNKGKRKSSGKTNPNPLRPIEGLPDILGNAPTNKGNTSSDADDESSKDFDIESKQPLKFTLDDSFRPASFYLSHTKQLKKSSKSALDEENDSSDSDLVSPPPVPSSPPPMEEVLGYRSSYGDSGLPAPNINSILAKSLTLRSHHSDHSQSEVFDNLHLRRTSVGSRTSHGSVQSAAAVTSLGSEHSLSNKDLIMSPRHGGPLPGIYQYGSQQSIGSRELPPIPGGVNRGSLQGSLQSLGSREQLPPASQAMAVNQLGSQQSLASKEVQLIGTSGVTHPENFHPSPFHHSREGSLDNETFLYHRFTQGSSLGDPYNKQPSSEELSSSDTAHYEQEYRKYHLENIQEVTMTHNDASSQNSSIITQDLNISYSSVYDDRLQQSKVYRIEDHIALKKRKSLDERQGLMLLKAEHEAELDSRDLSPRSKVPYYVSDILEGNVNLVQMENEESDGQVSHAAFANQSKSDMFDAITKSMNALDLESNSFFDPKENKAENERIRKLRRSYTPDPYGGTYGVDEGKSDQSHLLKKADLSHHGSSKASLAGHQHQNHPFEGTNVSRSKSLEGLLGDRPGSAKDNIGYANTNDTANSSGQPPARVYSPHNFNDIDSLPKPARGHQPPPPPENVPPLDLRPLTSASPVKRGQTIAGNSGTGYSHDMTDDNDDDREWAETLRRASRSRLIGAPRPQSLSPEEMSRKAREDKFAAGRQSLPPDRMMGDGGRKDDALSGRRSVQPELMVKQGGLDAQERDLANQTRSFVSRTLERSNPNVNRPQLPLPVEQDDQFQRLVRNENVYENEILHQHGHLPQQMMSGSPSQPPHYGQQLLANNNSPLSPTGYPLQYQQPMYTPPSSGGHHQNYQPRRSQHSGNFLSESLPNGSGPQRAVTDGGRRQQTDKRTPDDAAAGRPSNATAVASLPRRVSAGHPAQVASTPSGRPNSSSTRTLPARIRYSDPNSPRFSQQAPEENNLGMPEPGQQSINGGGLHTGNSSARLDGHDDIVKVQSHQSRASEHVGQDVPIERQRRRSSGSTSRRSSDLEKLKKRFGGNLANITAGDLLGKTQEELVLLLIQLRRQNSSLLETIDTCKAELDNMRNTRQQGGEDLRHHTWELEEQAARIQPIINLVDNMVKLGTLYRGGHAHADRQQDARVNKAQGLLEANLTHGGQERSQEQSNSNNHHNHLKRELHHVQSQLRLSHQKLEESSEEMSQFERDIFSLREELRASVQRDRRLSGGAGGPRAVSQHTNAVENELRDIQTKAMDLERMRGDLIRNINKLTGEESYLNNELHRSAPTGVAGAERLPSKQPVHGDTWLETNIDTNSTKDRGPETETQRRKESQAELVESNNGVYVNTFQEDQHNYENYQNFKNQMDRNPYEDDVQTVHSEGVRGEQDAANVLPRGVNQHDGPMEDGEVVLGLGELAEADERIQRFYGIIPKEKPVEIKTVRMVKRDNKERLGKGRRSEDDSESMEMSLEDDDEDDDCVIVMEDDTAPSSSPLGEHEDSPPPPLPRGNYQNLHSFLSNRQDHEHNNNNPRTASSNNNNNNSSSGKSTRSVSLSHGSDQQRKPNFKLGEYHGRRSLDSTSSGGGYVTGSLSRPGSALSAHERLFGATSREELLSDSLNGPMQQQQQQTTATTQTSLVSPAKSSSSIASSSGTEQSALMSPVFKSAAARAIIEEERKTPMIIPKARSGKSKRSKTRHMTITSSHPAVLEALDRHQAKQQQQNRSRDDLDLERVLKPRDAPDVVRSTYGEVQQATTIDFKENSIDSLFGVPDKIKIPERYVPEKENEVQSPDERRTRLQKADSIRRMLVDTSSANLPPANKRSVGMSNDDRREREQLLALNQVLARQVMERSRKVAGQMMDS